MTANRSVRVPAHVLMRVVDGELVVLNLDNEEYYGLDEVGTAMYQALTTAPTVSDAVQELLETYDVDEETIVRDVENLLQELSRRGLVEVDQA
jgi:hypothetical protein